MINYVYRPPAMGVFNLDDICCPQKLFELLDLAERYEVGNLRKVTSDALEMLDLTRENMIFAATVARNFKKVFDEVSTKLLS